MRVKPVVPNTRPEIADIENEIIRTRGKVPLLYQVLLNSPDFAQGWEKLLTAVRHKNSLPPAVRELVMLRVAVLNATMYEFNAHGPIALELGVSQEKIDALRLDSLPDIYSRTETVALQMADVMTREVVVPDSLYAQVEKEFSDQQILDLTITVGAYNMVCRVLTALEIG